MYHHVKKLMYNVRVGTPDPRFGRMLLEQFGGENGELAAALQYTVQAQNYEDPDLKDLLLDIGTEELSHLEVIGVLTAMHLKPMKTNREAADADPLLAICGGGGINLVNSMGGAWTANYLKITGEPEVDLRNNIAAEARAKITYERLIKFTDDQGSKDTLQFLMSREITHMKAFMLGLDNLGLDPLAVGLIPPTEGLVEQFLHTSTLGTDAATAPPHYISKAFDAVIDDPNELEIDGPGTRLGELVAQAPTKRATSRH